jgi:hypothetical protein
MAPVSLDVRICGRTALHDLTNIVFLSAVFPDGKPYCLYNFLTRDHALAALATLSSIGIAFDRTKTS